MLKTLLEFENAILDLFIDNKITDEVSEKLIWQLLMSFYRDELIKRPQNREAIIETIEKQKDTLLLNVFGGQS